MIVLRRYRSQIEGFTRGSTTFKNAAAMEWKRHAVNGVDAAVCAPHQPAGSNDMSRHICAEIALSTSILWAL